ncbi:MAG: BspA family leucine-rich repeat surface protein [Paludibacteraceae bacterium]|nr:BspA family leucine-rich repeat surface protein [Paludibacteraceae bacterium]
MKKHFLLALGLVLALAAQTANAGEKKVYSAYKAGTVTYYYDDLAESRQNNGYIVEDFPNDMHFESYYKDIKFARIDPSMKEAALTTTYVMFSRLNDNNNIEFNNIESITGLENLNTSQVTNMSNMFSGCCELTELDLSHFNTEKVVWMTCMFAYCKKIQALDLSSFKTTNVKHMRSMFRGCNALTSLDVSHFDISKVINMDYMFYDCPNLTTIYCDEDWSKYPSVSSTNMFTDCLLLVGGKGSTYKASYSNDITYARPDGGKDKPGYFTSTHCPMPTNVKVHPITTNSATVTWSAESENTGWRIYCREKDGEYYVYETTKKEYELTGLKSNTVYYVRVDARCNELESSWSDEVIFKTEVYIPAPTNLNVSSITCTSAILSWTAGDSNHNKWKIEVVSPYGQNRITIYNNPTTLKNLVPETKYTVRVRAKIPGGYSEWSYSEWSDTYTFTTPADVSTAEIYATLSGSEMRIMYDTKKSTTSGVIEKWTPGSGSSNMSNSDLATIQSVKFYASMGNVAPASLERWFSGMTNLTSVKNIMYLNTAGVTTMTAMFNECTSLTSLDLSGFNTERVEYMNDMFSGCTNLTTLKLTNFATERVQDMSYMFYGCGALTTIECDNDWSTASANSSSMFSGCTNLKGGRGTVYNSSETAKWYAHPDGGASNPGYFTTYQVDPADLQQAKDDLMELVYLASDVVEWLSEDNRTSEAMQLNTAIGAALNVCYDEEVTLEEVDAQRTALEAELSKSSNFVLSYLQNQAADELNGLLESDDSEECKKIISNAINYIMTLTWDSGKSFIDAYKSLEKTIQEVIHEAKINLVNQRQKDEATGIENVQSDNVPCTKVMKDGQLYLMYKGTMYNVQGARVK